MAEFLTHEEADSKYGSKSKTNAALTLGIIGTGLSVLKNNCGNGILNMLSGCNNCNNGNSDLYWAGRVEDLNEKSKMYIDLITRDNIQNLTLCDKLAAEREKDIKEKTEIFTALSARINELEKKEVATSTALPLLFELASVKANKYTDDCCCKSEKDMLIMGAELQRQLDKKVTGEVKLAYQNLCAPVPNISPLYCSPFTPNGSGTTYKCCSCPTTTTPTTPSTQQ